MAPVVKEFNKDCERFKTIVCVTAQHRHMLDQFLAVFDIKPDIDLNLMEKNQSLASFSSKAMTKLTRVFEKEKPDLVLVQGDTTTAMIAALAAFYQKIPVGHVEAGLRTGNKYNPFPEEINRSIIGTLAEYHFAPTETARKALLHEGISEEQIFLTGNTVVDALHMILKGLGGHSSGVTGFPEKDDNKLILVTSHRRENFGQPLENICKALLNIIDRNNDIEIVYPVHLNPNVQKTVMEYLSGNERIHLIKPVEYLDLVYLLNKAHIVLTDSGGIQEEAPALGKPALVLREETERPEGVDAGVARLVGTDENEIIKYAELLLKNKSEYEKMSKAVSPYGDGKAAKRIFDTIRNNL